MNILEQHKVAILNTDPEKTRAFFEKYKVSNRLGLSYYVIGCFYYAINGMVECCLKYPSEYNPASYDWSPPNTEESLNKKLSALITEVSVSGLSLEGGRFVKK